MFQDITTLLLDTKAFRDTIDLFVERYKDQGITVVAGNVYLCSPFFLSSDDLTMKKKVRIVSNAINNPTFLIYCCHEKQVLKLGVLSLALLLL